MAEYHCSPSELCPDTKRLAIRVHVPPAESVTEEMVLVAPVYSLTDRTRRCPAVDTEGNVAVSAVEAAVSLADALWTNAGPPVDGGFTVSEMVAEWLTPDPVAVMVIVTVPTGVVAEVPIVTTDAPPEVIDGGLNDSRAPAGMPEAVKVRGIALADTTAVVTVVDPREPALTAIAPGDTATEKESADAGVATLTVGDGPDELPAASRALTAYW